MLLRPEVLYADAPALNGDHNRSACTPSDPAPRHALGKSIYTCICTTWKRNVPREEAIEDVILCIKVKEEERKVAIA